VTPVLLNISIKDEFQTELLRLQLTLVVLHIYDFETLQHDILEQGHQPPWAPYGFPFGLIG
jgi:hypothetical protein